MKGDNIPVWYDEELDQCREVVVTYGAPPAVVVLQPVQHRLGEGHGCAGEPN